MPEVLGLDIGGANLKAAHSQGVARIVPFPLWKKPQELTEALRALMVDFPAYDLLAITMTGELCDCYASKKDGVLAILSSASQVAGRLPVKVWTTHGRFLSITNARNETLRVAAANWLAAAVFAGRQVSTGAALFIDMGSTTTDIVPLWNGRPVPEGWTDKERLERGELVYTGARRTPVCALLGSKVMAELFATTLDVYLALGLIRENAVDCDSADGRPATRPFAHARLARMLGGDAETVKEEETLALAEMAMEMQRWLVAEAVAKISRRLPEMPQRYVFSGSGTEVLRAFKLAQAVSIISLADCLAPRLSEAICAYAVALLAKEDETSIPP
jgi:probable H4MPT-linked C1 transfer pathway protein